MKQSYREKIYDFDVPRFDPTLLMVKAVENYEWANRKKINLKTVQENQLNHIILNFIRHRIVKNYNADCRSPSFENEPSLYLEWFRAVNTEIANSYPFLKKVVGQQIGAKTRQNMKAVACGK